MTIQEQKEAFLKALREDRYDTTTRLVFADWLYEQDRPEEANEQIRCSSQEWVNAAKWLEGFARSLGLSFEELLELVQARPGRFSMSDEFWRNCCLVTGKPKPENNTEVWEDEYFSCPC